MPSMTSALGVSRNRLSSYGEDLCSHVESILDEYLNTLSSRYKVCKLGLPRRALEYLAARELGWGDGGDVALDAVENGFLHILQWVSECYPDRTSWGKQSGRTLMDIAAARGHFSILLWLHANRSEGCTTRAMDRAAAAGNLEIVQWLHENQFLHEYLGEECTRIAANRAAANGHLAVTRYLLEKSSKNTAISAWKLCNLFAQTAAKKTPRRSMDVAHPRVRKRLQNQDTKLRNKNAQVEVV